MPKNIRVSLGLPLKKVENPARSGVRLTPQRLVCLGTELPIQPKVPYSTLKWVLVRFALRGDKEHNIKHQPIEAYVTNPRHSDPIDAPS